MNRPLFPLTFDYSNQILTAVLPGWERFWIIHLILDSLIAHFKSLCGPICSAALSKCSSFGMPTCLANALSAMPTSALRNKDMIQKNPSTSMKIWLQVCPDTELTLGNSLSVYNLVLSRRRSWDSISVRYHLVRIITADHIYSCVMFLNVFFSYVTLQPHFKEIFSEVGKWCLKFDTTSASIISMLPGVICNVSMNRFVVALWCPNAISQMEGL